MSYEGSPVSKGVLQPDMWEVTPSDRWDWPGIRQSVAQHGIRNSLLVAPMPTASTSQVCAPFPYPVQGHSPSAVTYPMTYSPFTA